MYVALEGIDTAGKSTQIALLKQKFPQAIFTCEPGGSALGQRLRAILLQDELSISKQAECLLFLSDRAEHIHKVILKHSSSLIVSDRSLVSGVAYAKEFDFETMLALNRFATQGIFPDCVILLELCKDELEKRLRAKKQDKIEQRGVDFLLEIQARMIEITLNLDLPLIRIDAQEERESIHQKICSILQ